MVTPKMSPAHPAKARKKDRKRRVSLSGLDLMMRKASFRISRMSVMIRIRRLVEIGFDLSLLRLFITSGEALDRNPWFLLESRSLRVIGID